MEHMNKKNEMKMRKLNEEREYLENISRKEQQEEDRKKIERLKRISETMNEYKEMVSHNPEGRIRKNKFEDVKINTYGVSGKDYGKDVFNRSNYNDSNSNLNNPLTNGNYLQKEKTLNRNATMSPQVNNVKKLVNYDPNNYNPVKEDYITKIQKMEQQKMYKDFLDSQVKKINLKFKFL
jgi:hypothetical protein